MKICVVGAGAMGCLFGGYLAKSGHEVWLIARSKDHVDSLSDNGLEIHRDGLSEFIPVNASLNPLDAGICDVVLVMTKFRDTYNALEGAKSTIGPDTILVTLQNGIGNVEQIIRIVDPENILYGVTTLGAARRGPGRIEITAGTGAKTYVWSEVNRETLELTKFVGALSAAGIDAVVAPDAKERVWRKLCLNSCVSVLAAITGLKVGPLVESSSACTLILNLVKEISGVAAKEGVLLEPILIYKELIEDSRRFADHAPSILVDVLAHRKTEIECLNGAIVDAGARHNVPTPYNHAVASIVETLEQSYKDRVS